MVKTIAWILVIWVAISFIYSYKKGERIDGDHLNNFLKIVIEKDRLLRLL